MPQKISGEILCIQDSILGHAQGIIEDMEQFPDIARPVMVPEQLPKPGSDGMDGLAAPILVFLQIPTDQLIQIPHPFP